jgi:hypothetical protein
MLLLISLLVPIGCANEPKGNPEAEKAAVQAARDWLAGVDAGELGASWEKAAEYLRSAVGKDVFEQQLKAARSPLGTVKSRELDSQKYQTSVPGAPDGKYVIIQFKTSFENKASAVETITPMQDRDGKWRISGYFIK